LSGEIRAVALNYLSTSFGADQVNPSPWWSLGVFAPPALFARCFFSYAKGKLEERSHSASALRTFFAYAGLIGLIGLTALFAVYPAWLVTVFYQERGAMGGWGEALMFVLLRWSSP